jgi:predicted component of type VI protein secretion system
MEESRVSTGSAGAPPEGLRCLPGAADEPAGFVPLRLRWQSCGAVVVLHEPDVLVGRHSEADVRLPLPDVSRRHCRFTFGDGQWALRDLNSLNGVFLNDERVDSATVRHGDRVKIGGFVFSVELTPLDLPAPPDAGDQQILRSIVAALPRSADDEDGARKAG